MGINPEAVKLTAPLRRRALQDRVTPWDVELLVANLMSTVEAGDDLPGRPYRHANNFNKIPLCSSPTSGITVVLHLWRDQLSPVGMDSDVHDHRWDFCSRILVGTLRNKLYEVAEDGEEHQAWAYSSSGSGSDYGLMETAGTVRIQLSSAALFRAGSSYYQRGHLLHTAAPLVLPTITVVARGHPDRPSATDLLNAGRSPGLQP
jgi:hypothetical protein